MVMALRKPANPTEIEKVPIPTPAALVARARYIAAVGRFTKLNDSTWLIEAEEMDGTATETYLKQNAFKQIICNCGLYLQEGAAKNRNYRCEHKIALRIHRSLPDAPHDVRLNPLAQTLEDLIGTEQQRHLRQLANNLGLKSPAAASRAILGCGFDECSREAAQFLIDCLVEIQNA